MGSRNKKIFMDNLKIPYNAKSWNQWA